MALLVERVVRSATQRGTEYRFTYEVSDAEAPSYYRVYQQSISDLIVTEYPVDSAVCFTCSQERAGAGKWLMRYWGIGSDWNINIIPGNIRKSYGNSNFHFTIDMFGARRATATDVANLIFNSDAGVCVQNDVIFNNATKDGKGTAVFAGSPFTATTMQSLLDSTALGSNHAMENMLAVLDYPVPTSTYTVEYPNVSTATSEWRGVNPAGGTSGFGAGLAPDDTREAIWRTVSAKQQPVYKGSATNFYISRVMEKAPWVLGVQMIWDETVYGPWTW
jgi:hypothetical protein